MSYLLGEDFENLVRNVYLAEGFRILAASPARDQGFDFLAGSPGGERVVIEVKALRTRVVPRGIIISALTTLEAARMKAKADKGLLVISGHLAIPVRDVGNVDVVDINKLAEMVARHPSLATDFESIARQLTPMPFPNEESLSARIMGDAYVGVNLSDIEPEPVKNSFGMIEALRSIKSGKKGASEFELRAYNAVKYIFEDDFANWSRQKVTDGGISRYDAIARISSVHDFWTAVSASFRSWYVVFEFKNYTGRITQGQIYTTEKYLFLGAMRSIAFIVSSKGADNNALAAARGAVRELGKLIVNLSVDDICEMIEMKDRGDDPNSFLFDRLDDMLMRLER